jgi:hypothetical protein
LREPNLGGSYSAEASEPALSAAAGIKGRRIARLKWVLRLRLVAGGVDRVAGQRELRERSVDGRHPRN